MSNRFRPLQKWIAALLAAALLFSLSGCSDGKADAVVRFELDALPTTFDPQLASSYAELLAVRNLYEGLFRLDNDGKAVPAVATSYDVSDDGLLYTFHLREGVQWRNETPLTAADFVYGLQRAADPVTRAPFADELRCIQNFSAALSGSVLPSQIGVTALDDQTLQIQLAFADPEFFEVLASAVAMPCNRQFFDSAGGQYGLVADKVLTNGSFRLYSWQESLVRLSISTAYKGAYAAKIGAVIFTLADSKATDTRADRIAAGTIDVGRITDAEYEAVGKSLSVTSFEDISYILVFNPASSLGKGDIAGILTRAFDRSRFEDGLHDYLTTAGSLIPSALTLGGESYRSLSQVSYSFSYDPAGAKADLLAAVSDLPDGKLPSITLLYPDTPGVSDIATAIALDWQENLGAYVNINADTAEKIRSRVSSGSYQVAILPITSADNTVSGFFENFVTGSSVNRSGFSDPAFDAAATRLTEQLHTDAALAAAMEAEQILANSRLITPLAFGHTRYAVSSGVRKIGFSLTGGAVDFAFVEKKS